MVYLLEVWGGVSDDDVVSDRGGLRKFPDFETGRVHLLGCREDLVGLGYVQVPGGNYQRRQQWVKLVLVDEHGVEWR